MSKTLTLVDNDFELREAARIARMDLYDRKVQGIFSDISIVTTPRNQKLVIVSKRMERINSNNEKYDELVCHGAAAKDAGSIFGMGVRGKIADVTFPFKNDIEYYGPLTDVNSDDMSFFVTHEAADIMDSAGVDLELFGEELDEIQSVSAKHEQIDLAEATYSHRSEISRIKKQMSVCRAKIIARHPDWADLYHNVFVQKLLECGEGSDSQHYLELETRLIKNKRNIDTYSASIMSLTLPSVFVPNHIDINDIRLPQFDLNNERYVSEVLTLAEVDEIANKGMEYYEDIPELPELVIDL